jgi:multiple sugar transport system permease protein
MVSSTFKDQVSVITEGFNLIPKNPSLKAYRIVLSTQPFLKYFLNSLIVSLAVVAGNMVFSPMAGYAFAKKSFPGKKFFFILLLSTMMIPVYLILIPIYRTFIALEWMNTYQALIIPFLAAPISIFLMRQYIMGLPDEIIQAAKIDGASEIGIFVRIIYPLLGPCMAVLVINTFLNIWNSFLWPLLFTTESNMWTLMVGLYNYGGYKQQVFNERMVCATLAALPTTIVFLFFQKYIISGLTSGAIKG